ncbi:M15 family metallopeptidase [Parasphingopyxis lamellibrachiae]|uniref:D-alanyl-D-alanine carboxypeptidase-like protein n=1 Tax=Parasphingopyxis lamellibrachiae TaxID=680125 RepID=A0A3D9FH10_9SPHN|nr:M15 family metallopeptidase [Parasphingopyxis lamellibrachiae]RED16852.1 D-alanyl-D-alanine carboxypeptidase-like protein [Parasphingopyxis lamellibrachiae]
MIDDRTLQRALAARGHYAGLIDGRYGDLSRRATRLALIGDGLAIADWIDPRCRIALEQSLMAEAGIETGAIDGLTGPQTRIALEQWQNRLRGLTPRAAEVAHQPAIFPRQRDAGAFYGEPGQSQTMLELPFPMRLAWDRDAVIRRFSIHEKAHDSAARAFAQIRDFYGEAALRNLGLDLFGGSLNVRNMRGGKALSMHSWGIAIDFDPAHNALRWGRDRARMAGPDYAAFLDIWEAQGWISLGRERNYDWMHVQAARL